MASLDIRNIRTTDQLISKGATAKVYLARNTQTGQKYALKVIIKESLGSRMLAHVRQEARLVMTFNHPHIVKTYYTDETVNKIKILMELFSGDLLSFTKEYGKLIERDAYIIFRQIASAIDYLHNEKHIVHRDIKLSNILFNNDDDMTVVLADFGFAAERDPNGPLFTTVLGTRGYIAPEILAKTGYQGYPADIYALGVCLYIMVSGRNPDSQGFINDNFSPELVDLLRKMVKTDEKNRIDIKEIINHPWMKMFD
jgi:serine/threonine protein kinase